MYLAISLCGSGFNAEHYFWKLCEKPGFAYDIFGFGTISDGARLCV